jgi:hypothetical protein
VVSVRRRGRTVIPRGSLTLLLGDALVILAEDDAAEELRELNILPAERDEPRQGMARLWPLSRP